jgi:hypothetical protein
VDSPCRIEFDVAGETVVVHLYLPQFRGGPIPRLVVAGPMSAVKEQVADVYAAAHSARDFSALALDHRTMAR